MRTFVNLNEALALLRTGEWELGYSDGSRGDGSYWLQRGGLCKGGETRGVRAGTVAALEKRKLIKVAARQTKQPFWLRRYEFTESANQ